MLGAMWFWVVAKIWEAYLGEMMLWELWLGRDVIMTVGVVLVGALVVGGCEGLGWVWRVLLEGLGGE